MNPATQNPFHHPVMNLGSSKWSATAVYFVSFIIIGMLTAVTGPSIPSLAENTGAKLGQMSILFTSRSLGYLLGALWVGPRYDKWAGHKFMAGMLVLTALFCSLVPMITLLWLLTMVMLVLGFTESTVDVGCNTFMVWTHRDKSPPFMNALHFFFGLGGFLAPILVAQIIILHDNVTWVFWILSLFILPVAGWMMSVSNPSPSRKRLDQNMDDKKTVSFDISSKKRKMFTGMVLFIGIYVGVEGGFGGWIYSYGLTTGLTDKAGAAYLTSVFWATFTMGRLISIPIALRFKPIVILFTGLLGTILSFSSILVFAEHLNVLILATAGVGLFMAPAFPTTFSFCERRIGITGKMTSLFFVGASIGGMTLPWCFGQLLEYYNPYVMMAAITFSVILAFVVLSFIYVVYVRGSQS